MPPSQKLHRSLLGFLDELSRNNKREWFQANKDRYIAEVRDPLLGFIEAFAPKLRRISPYFVADARSNGGSLFRIYRDTRFSKDKTPYKTWGAVQFRHERGKDVHAPGFYLHVQPGNVFMGAGLWHPDAPTLAKIREAIVEGPANWRRAISAKAFKESYELAGDSLKRPPRGFDAEHELIDDLKRKDFIAVAHFTEAQLLRSDFLDQFAKTAGDAKPFMRFLTKAVALDF